ncbi:hypothetical protein TNCV_4930851 [Trichonephila clavipes]|nr:hypothetical protein TNCV_4930851 [Trichonephila clavipes]
MGQRHVYKILRPHVEPFRSGLPGVIFQRDSACPHTARDFHVQTFQWPAPSPDLSYTEHLTEQLERKMLLCL